MTKQKQGKRVSRYQGAPEEVKSKLKDLVPMNANQERYIHALNTKKQIITTGPSGCKTGDTLIHFRRGKRNSSRTICLKDFVDKFNGVVKGSGAKSWLSLPTYVQSFNEETKTISYNLVEGAYYTGVKEVMQVTTDNSGLVKITLDDSILMEDGTFKTVSNLKVGDRVLCKGSNKPVVQGEGGRKKRASPRVVVEGLKYYESGWHKFVTCNGITYTYKRSHRARLVIEAAMNGVSYETYLAALKSEPNHTYKVVLGKDLEVHHIDGDVTNDDISNLKVMHFLDHLRLHKDQSIKNFHRQTTVVSTITHLENLGLLEVFDLTMAAPDHNFVCNDGIIVHNTGKTFCAATHAANLYLTKRINKIILTRPAVAVGRTLGALPGDLNDKYSPWLFPILDVLNDQLGKGVVDTGIKNGNIIMAPLEYMRGSSFNNSFVLLDEGQNLNMAEFKMLVTRIGDNSTLVINGDIKQSDLREQSGLAKAIQLAKKYKMDAAIIEFGLDDIVRSDICKQWVTAFYEENI